MRLYFAGEMAAAFWIPAAGIASPGAALGRTIDFYAGRRAATSSQGLEAAGALPP